MQQVPKTVECDKVIKVFSSGTIEELNSYLCQLADQAETLAESTRANYVDLQLRLEANSQTISGIENEVEELNNQEQELTSQVNTVNDAIDCGIQGNSL